MDIKERCASCGIIQKESWPTHYKRTHAKKLIPFLCKDCKKVQFLIDNPEIVMERDRKRAEKLAHKKEMERIGKLVPIYEENIAWKQDIKEKRRTCVENYLKTEKGREAYRKGWEKRREIVLKAMVDITDEERKKIKEFYGKCKDGYHVDHIIPLSKGGKHCLENLQYLEASENAQKRNKIRLSDLKKHLKGEIISASLLMRKFRIEWEKAREILEELNLVLEE